jgi:hypothetical protein
MVTQSETPLDPIRLQVDTPRKVCPEMTADENDDDGELIGVALAKRDNSVNVFADVKEVLKTCTKEER